MILEKLHTERKLVEDLTRTFCVISGTAVAEAGEMTKAQFISHMSVPAMRTFFAVLGLEIWDPSRFFDLLASMSANSRLDVQVFVSGCMQLRAKVTGIAVQGILADIQSVAGEVINLREAVMHL